MLSLPIYRDLGCSDSTLPCCGPRLSLHAPSCTQSSGSHCTWGAGDEGHVHTTPQHREPPSCAGTCQGFSLGLGGLKLQSVSCCVDKFWSWGHPPSTLPGKGHPAPGLGNRNLQQRPGQRRVSSVLIALPPSLPPAVLADCLLRSEQGWRTPAGCWVLARDGQSLAVWGSVLLERAWERWVTGASQVSLLPCTHPDRTLARVGRKGSFATPGGPPRRAVVVAWLSVYRLSDHAPSTGLAGACITHCSLVS